MKTLQEIQERLAQIDEELRKEGITIEEVRKLQAEIKELNAAKEEIRKAAEQAAKNRRVVFLILEQDEVKKTMTVDEAKNAGYAREDVKVLSKEESKEAVEKEAVASELPSKKEAKKSDNKKVDDSKKNEKKAGLLGSGKEPEQEEKMDGDCYRVKKPQPISAAGSTYKTGRKAKAEAEAKKREAEKQQRKAEGYSKKKSDKKEIDTKKKKGGKK